MLRASLRLECLDLDLARETYRDAFYAALTAGNSAAVANLQEVARATRTAIGRWEQPNGHDRLLSGLGRLVTDGYAAGAPPLRQALNTLRDGDLSTEAASRWLPLACRVSHNLWDERTHEVLSARLVHTVRSGGALGVLPLALLLRLGCVMFEGDITNAAALAEECKAVAAVTGSHLAPYGAMWVAAWRGDESGALGVIAEAGAEMTDRGEGQWIPAAAWALSLVHNSRGHYENALVAAEAGSTHPNELGLAIWCLVELVEAAVRTGSPERGVDALQQLSDIAEACQTDWALGVVARLTAMSSEGESAETGYREAIKRLERSRIRTELARAHLVYGEWLRRENRRVHAREQLRTAYHMFSTMQIDGFADRARRELLATGETVRKRTVETALDLTAQEAQIAQLAVQGNTNPEIGTQLFISPRTVEWHLRKVFSKLGVGSRKQLRAALLTGHATAASPGLVQAATT